MTSTQLPTRQCWLGVAVLMWLGSLVFVDLVFPPKRRADHRRGIRTNAFGEAREGVLACTTRAWPLIKVAEHRMSRLTDSKPVLFREITHTYVTTQSTNTATPVDLKCLLRPREASYSVFIIY